MLANFCRESNHLRSLEASLLKVAGLATTVLGKSTFDEDVQSGLFNLRLNLNPIIGQNVSTIPAFAS